MQDDTINNDSHVSGQDIANAARDYFAYITANRLAAEGHKGVKTEVRKAFFAGAIWAAKQLREQQVLTATGS